MSRFYFRARREELENRSVCVYTRGFEHHSNAAMEKKMGVLNSYIRDALILIVFLLGLMICPGPDAWAGEPVPVKQGDIVRIVIKPGVGATSIKGKFEGKSIPYFKLDQEGYAAIIGIDMDHSIGTLPFTSSWKRGGITIQWEDQIEIKAAKFGLQELTLPKKKVDLDQPTLKRVRREKGLMIAAFAQSVQQKLWKGPFIAPVEGKRQGTFGRRRLINGKPRRSHTGEDISAPKGTPILATNSGKVVLVGHFFFNGRSIVIDHGLGLFSMYFHLSEVNVVKGERVKVGKRIGRVGKSGRVTGPHLHWGMRLNNARIDPYDLVDAKLD